VPKIEGFESNFLTGSDFKHSLSSPTVGPQNTEHSSKENPNKWPLGNEKLAKLVVGDFAFWAIFTPCTRAHIDHSISGVPGGGD